MWICNPNNPTGAVLPHDEMKRLTAQHPDVLFVIDQSYEDFTPRMLFSPHEAAALSNVILLHSLTKRFGIPGLRVGYLTARQEWTARIRRNKMPWSVNTLALEAALFLTEHEKDFRIDLQSLLEERARVAGQLEALRIAEVWPGETHFLLARLRMGKASALKDYLAETHGMLIRDAGNFEGLDERYFRIAVQSPEEDDRLLAAIGEWMFPYNHAHAQHYSFTYRMGVGPLRRRPRPAAAPHSGFRPLDQFFERKANHGDHRRAKGTFWTVTTLCTLFLSAHLALAALWTACLQWEAGGTYLYYLVTGILIFYCLAGTTLIREVRRVFRAADRSLEEGRRQVSRIVGRDTSRLSDQEIRTAALETLAENLSDGVIAPLFWLYVLGIPGMLTYK